jgi:hypothetical protein
VFFVVVDVRDLNGFGFPPTQIGNTEDAKIKSYIITAVYEQKKREREKEREKESKRERSSKIVSFEMSNQITYVPIDHQLVEKPNPHMLII